MKKIEIENIVVDNYSFKELYDEYFKLKLDIKTSDKKLAELQTFISDDLFDRYLFLKDNELNELQDFLLENPLLSEFIDENQYNLLLKERLDFLLQNKLDLTKLSNGINCDHEFIKLNNKLLCIKCFIKEEEFSNQDEDILDFIKDIALSQNMYIGEIDESELGYLEKIRSNHKSLIDKLKKQRKNLPAEERYNLDETINNLEDNKIHEYRKSLKKYRKNKLSIK